MNAKGSAAVLRAKWGSQVQHAEAFAQKSRISGDAVEANSLDVGTKKCRVRKAHPAVKKGRMVSGLISHVRHAVQADDASREFVGDAFVAIDAGHVFIDRLFMRFQ